MKDTASPVEVGLLDVLVGAIARAFRVDPSDVVVDSDLFDPAGFTLRGRILDSLELVEMVTAAEEALDVDLETLLEARSTLTLRDVADFASGSCPGPGAGVRSGEV